jgi:hypothetical protein
VHVHKRPVAPVRSGFGQEGEVLVAPRRFALDGYIVKEVARKGEGFGKIRQVWSTYEGRHTAADSKPFVRGINSFQLVNDGKRWWIFSVVWQPETTKVALPAEYLQ